jgi:hypothetical protein
MNRIDRQMSSKFVNFVNNRSSVKKYDSWQT